MKLNVIFKNQPEFFSIQKLYVDYSFIDSAFKYGLIPVTKDLKFVCKLIPKKDIPDNCFVLDCSVIQFTTFASLSEVIQKTSLNINVQINDIRMYNSLVNAKCIDVSIVLKTSADVLKWKSSEELLKILKDILVLYVVVNNSLIILPKFKANGIEVIFVCIHDTKSKKCLSRITSSTTINIKQLMSMNKFKILCSNSDSFKVVALPSQLKLLNSIYNAQLHLKSSRQKTNFVQKVLLIGPSGCGKTRLVQYFASIKKCGLVIIEVSRLSHSTPGESENILVSLFNEAVQRSKEELTDISIIFLDQIDGLCRKTNNFAVHLKRLTNQLFHLLEKVKDNPGVIVIAATNNIHLLDPAIRCGTRLEIEAYIGMPSETERQEILQLYCHNRMRPSILKKVAACTSGYVGADLLLLVRDVLRIRYKNLDLYQKESELFDLFRKCITKLPPSCLRSSLGITPLKKISMNCLGGLTSVKLQLKSFIEWPIKHSESFKKLGLPVPKGILLYGPPGCAKTSLACATAEAMNINFLSVSAAELYSPFVGEAEKNVIELFSKARISSPCIIFIDEIDALVGNRNSNSRNVQTSILSSFLTEMDGIGHKLESLFLNEKHISSVIVIAATNRLDKLDSALLRPGRFDKLIYVGPPDFDDRIDILRTIVRQWKMPINNCVDFFQIAEKTDFFTGSDLVNLMKEAGYMALFQEGMSASRIKQKHILNSLNNITSLQK